MASEFKKKLFWRAVAAEFLAMTLFVFISIGSALGFNYPLKNNQTSGAMQDNVKVSLAFGLSIATLAQSVGHISGAHLNPAVTLGLLLSCQISILRAITYMVAQCVGAIVATAILSGITSSLSDNSLGRNAVSGGPPPPARGRGRGLQNADETHPAHPPPIVQMGLPRTREHERWPEVMRSQGWNSVRTRPEPASCQALWEAETCRTAVSPMSPAGTHCEQ